MQIYQPKGRAREYADWALNIYRSCSHACTYCYVPNTLRTKRKVYNQGDIVLKKFSLAGIERELKNGQHKGHLVHLSFIGDPYCPLDVKTGYTREVIKLLHQYGAKVQILTKGGKRALRDLDLLGDGDWFGATLTFDNNEDSLKWESGAALPDDRLDALALANTLGIKTWVSIEPVIIPQQSLALIRQSSGFVDLYKVGAWNYDKRANELNWLAFWREAESTLSQTKAEYLFKTDLLERAGLKRG